MSGRMQAMLEYDVVDVFTDRAFAGNPLAVVHGAHDLDDAQMRAIAREFNLSETTFPAAPGGSEERSGGPRDRYSVRIFTPGGEIPFAGHPTLGTAWVLREYGLIDAGAVVQRCGAGDIEVEVPADPGGLLRLSAQPRDLSGALDADAVAAGVGLSPDAVVGEVRAAGCGLTWVHLPVRPDALERCRPGPDLVDALRGVTGTHDPVAGVNVYCVDDGADGGAGHDAGSSGGPGEPLVVRSRVFCPDVGVAEDPATGSAAVGLGVALVATGRLSRGGEYTITQGVQMGRPSTLRGSVEVGGGRARRCAVAGRVVAVASGTIAVPVPAGTEAPDR